MKKLLISIALALASTLTFGANPSVSLTIGGIQFSSGSAAPGSCSPDGSYFFVNGTGWQQCVNSVYVGFGSGGSGTVTTFSAGTLSPLFTTSVANPTTAPALTFTLSNAGAGTILGNPSGAPAAPSYTATPVLGLPGTTVGTLGFANATSGSITLSPPTGALGAITITLPANSQTMVVAPTSTTTTQSLFATATGGAPAFRAIATGDLPTSGIPNVVYNNAVNTGTAPMTLDMTASNTAGAFSAPTGSCALISERFGSTSTVGLAQGATTAQIGFTNGTNCSILYAVAVTPTFRMASGGLWAFSATSGDATASLDIGVSRIAPNILGIGSGSQGSTTGLLEAGNHVFVTADFTDANSAALQAITGLTYAIGSTAQKLSFHCSLMYSQATASAGDQFGVGVITTAPTNVSAYGTAWQNTTAGTDVYGVLTGLTTVTPTSVVTFTPAVTTVLGANLDGTVETAGGGAATFNIYVLNGTAANVIVVKRGSYCELY